MTIFLYKGLTRNPEIGNNPVWVLPNICRLGWVRGTKFGTNVSNEIFPNAAKCQGYSFCLFWVIKGKLTVGAQTCNFIKKETLAQVFSCEFCQIFKNNYFYRKPPVEAFCIGVLLYICCIFSEHLFLRTPLEGCFWYKKPNLIWRGTEKGKLEQVQQFQGHIIKD